MRKPTPTRTVRVGPDLHFLVRKANRRAMAEHQTEAAAYDLASALVRERWPQAAANARRPGGGHVGHRPGAAWQLAQ